MNFRAEHEFQSMRRALMAADRAERRGYLREADTLGAMAANCCEIGIELDYIETAARHAAARHPEIMLFNTSGSAGI